MAQIEVGGRLVLFDDADLELVQKHSWRLSPRLGQCYVQTTICESTVFMHRFILPVTDSDLVVDHKDGNGLNNRRDNLQRITQSQNQQRQHIGYSNVSGYKGVAWQKSRKRWYAS